LSDGANCGKISINNVNYIRGWVDRIPGQKEVGTGENQMAGVDSMDSNVQVESLTDDLMQTAEQLFSDHEWTGRRQMTRHPLAWRPPTDLFEEGDAFIARIEVAGMKGGYLSVSIADKLLTVTGIRQYPGARGAYHQMEIRYGEFRTQVRLPTSVDEEKVEASYTDGFLTILIPKKGVHRVKVVPGHVEED
jgi:HSP20 family protein